MFVQTITVSNTNRFSVWVSPPDIGKCRHIPRESSHSLDHGVRELGR